MRQNKHLRKSRQNRVVSGVCGGIGEYTGIDPVLIRVAFVIGFFMSGGMVLLGYLLMMFVMPKGLRDAPAPAPRRQRRTVDVPVRDDDHAKRKRKNDDDILHYARPLSEIEAMREKNKRKRH
ncbi:MAG: PspC domain-containing protein [Anaerolineaceae bacterium]|nr:MAG: PspC domain-containing protein [Anaerolineaceae bacterium]